MCEIVISTYFEVSIGIYPTLVFNVVHKNIIQKIALMFWTALIQRSQKLMEKKAKVGLKQTVKKSL